MHFKGLKKELSYFQPDYSEFIITPDIKTEVLKDLNMLMKDPLKKLKLIEQINLMDSD